MRTRSSNGKIRSWRWTFKGFIMMEGNSLKSARLHFTWLCAALLFDCIIFKRKIASLNYTDIILIYLHVTVLWENYALRSLSYKNLILFDWTPLWIKIWQYYSFMFLFTPWKLWALSAWESLYWRHIYTNKEQQWPYCSIMSAFALLCFHGILPLISRHY